MALSRRKADRIQELRALGLAPAEIARAVGCGRRTVAAVLRGATPGPSREPPSPFGRRLAALRRECGLSRPELARRAGLHVRVVEWWEREGKEAPRPATVAALERGLGSRGALTIRACAACGGPAIGRRWCEKHAPGGGR